LGGPLPRGYGYIEIVSGNTPSDLREIVLKVKRRLLAVEISDGAENFDCSYGWQLNLR